MKKLAILKNGVGENLKQARERKGLSEVEVARLLKLDSGMEVEFWESDLKEIPLGSFLHLMQLYGCDANDIIPDNPPENKNVYRIPVSWETRGVLEIESSSLENALKEYLLLSGRIVQAEIIDGSFEADSYDVDMISKIYNGGRK